MLALGRHRGGLITAGAAVRLIILQQPSTTATTGQVLARQPVVAAVDASGILVSVAGRTITVAASIGTLSGSVTAITDSNGFATFAGLGFNAVVGQPQTNQTLTFTGTGLLPVVSASVLVSDPGATDIDALVAIGNCEVLLDAISGMTIVGGNINTLVDLSGKNRTVALPDGVVPATATKWNATQPAWQFVSGTKHRIKIVGGTGAPPLGVIPVPLTVVSLIDGMTNPGGGANMYRDNVNRSVGFVEVGGQWALFDGSVYDSGFTVGNQGGKVLTMHGHNGAASFLTANDAEETPVDTGVGSGGMGEYYIGSNSANTQPANIAAQPLHILYSKALSLAERNAVRTIVYRRYGGIVIPTAGHGPLTSANGVYGGTTVTIDYVLGFSGGDNFNSSELYLHTLVFHFSAPIRQFSITQLTTEFDGSVGVTNAPSLVACDAFSLSAGYTNIHDGYSFVFYGNAPGERGSVRYDPGFQTAVIRNALINSATYGVLRSLWSDARFWLVGEPL